MGVQGGIIDAKRPLHVSNVLIFIQRLKGRPGGFRGSRTAASRVFKSNKEMVDANERTSIGAASAFIRSLSERYRRGFLHPVERVRPALKQQLD